MSCSAILLAAAVSVNFNLEVGKIRPELHSSGFGPQICSCPQENLDNIKSMNFKAARTHDWALINPNERVCDYFHIFPLMHLDAKDPSNYVFGPTDYLLKRTRDEMGLDIFYRLGTSIEHSGPKVHFNSLIPEDFDKVAEIFAGTIRHYNCGWANGYKWGIKYWEIWNEPDGFNNMWCLPDGDGGVGDTEDARKADRKARDLKRRALFVKFFVTCLKRIKSEFPDVKVGGPAMCGMSTDYFRDILKGCKEAGVAPDFISWHHYSNSVKVIMDAIEAGRKLCDEMGFPKCELIINEWHYFDYEKYGWADLRSPIPEKRAKAWSGPASHNGIDSSCFNLTMLTKFQSSKLDQAYYYGCRNVGAWGFLDGNQNKYKVFFGLKMFGDFLRQCQTMCSAAGTDKITVLAGKGKGGEKAVLVTDFRSGEHEISVDITGMPENGKPTVLMHDYTHDLAQVPAVFSDGKLLLKKTDTNSAAFLIMF